MRVRLRLHQSVGVNISGGRMPFRIEVDLRLRTQYGDRVRRARLCANVFADLHRFRKWICSIDHSIGFGERPPKEKVGFGPERPRKTKGEDSNDSNAHRLCANAYGVE